MKTTSILRLQNLTAALLLMLTCGLQMPASAQGTAFTYQGRLNNNTASANGFYDFTFTIYDLPAGNGSFATQTILATSVTNGLFTVTIDFGAGIFTGADRWLEIAVRTNGPGAFTTMTPRQLLTPTPYAITAENLVSGGLAAGTYGNAITLNNPGNNFSGNGGGLLNVNAGTLGGLAPSSFWQLFGNNSGPGQFLGNVNNQPLEIRVNNTSALRIMPASVPSLEGGYFQNSAHGSSSAAIVSGGASGSINEVFGDYGFIGAGHGAKAGSFSAVVGGGYNVAPSQFSFIGAGLSNSILADYSIIAGGQNNLVAGGGGAVIGGGAHNSATDYNATVAGGANNIADANGAAIAGGSENRAGGDHSAVGGGQANSIETDAANSIIGGGAGNRIQDSASHAAIGGGYHNLIGTNAYNTTIPGGDNDTVEPFAVSSVIGGGSYNLIQRNAHHSILDGGEFNAIQTNATYATIGGGHLNTIRGNANESTIGGGLGNSVGCLVTNSAISGATVAGGVNNRADCAFSFVGGGRNNSVTDTLYYFGFQYNSPYSVIAGGEGNSIGTVTANLYFGPADHSAIGGGISNSVYGDQSVISGGGNNLINSGTWSAIPGGQNNEIDGNWSFAAGQRAKALHSGTFVWADYTGADFASTADNQFCIRARGGIQVEPQTRIFFGAQTRQMLNLFGTQYGVGVQTATEYFRSASDFCWFKGGVHNDGQHSPGAGGTEMMRLESNGNLLISGAFGSLSDRNAKERFEPVDAGEVLEKVAALPLSRWSYKHDPSTRHLGPMAQDFYAAFSLGADERHIMTVDEEGIALAAIQGLNQKIETKDAEIQALKKQNAALEQRLDHLEALVERIATRN